MMYVEFNAGGREYKLRINTRATVALEKKIGCNPLAIFGDGDTMPTITTMVAILHASLQQYEHNISLDDAYDIWDSWVADGHDMTEFIPIILEVYKESGIIKNKGKAEKN